MVLCACAASHLTALPESLSTSILPGPWREMSLRSIRARTNPATQSLEASVPAEMSPLAVAPGPAKDTRHCFNVSVSAVTATGAQIILVYLCLHVEHGGVVVHTSTNTSRWQSVAMRACEEGEIRITLIRKTTDLLSILLIRVLFKVTGHSCVQFFDEICLNLSIHTMSRRNFSKSRS
jgi:hypothetical protein